MRVKVLAISNQDGFVPTTTTVCQNHANEATSPIHASALLRVHTMSHASGGTLP